MARLKFPLGKVMFVAFSFMLMSGLSGCTGLSGASSTVQPVQNGNTITLTEFFLMTLAPENAPEDETANHAILDKTYKVKLPAGCFTYEEYGAKKTDIVDASLRVPDATLTGDYIIKIFLPEEAFKKGVMDNPAFKITKLGMDSNGTTLYRMEADGKKPVMLSFWVSEQNYFKAHVKLPVVGLIEYDEFPPTAEGFAERQRYINNMGKR